MTWKISHSDSASEVFLLCSGSQWQIYPVSHFMQSYKFPLPPLAADYISPFQGKFVVEVVDSRLNAVKQTRQLTIVVRHPQIIWTGQSKLIPSREAFPDVFARLADEGVPPIIQSSPSMPTSSAGTCPRHPSGASSAIM